MARIGIFGGSFNPPTIAHKALADYAFAMLNLDKLLWVVCPQNVDKDPKNLAPFEHRMKMVELILSDRPKMEASRIEEHQFSTETIVTVSKLRKEHPDDHLFFLMGMDNWKSFHKWGDDYAEILDKVSIVVFQRPKYEGLDAIEASREFATARVELPSALQKSGSWIALENPLYDMAATQARDALAASRSAALHDILHADTLAYIKREGLY
jgi:nicotinate-nucleotide adenylyltransferase